MVSLERSVSFIVHCSSLNKLRLFLSHSSSNCLGGGSVYPVISKHAFSLQLVMEYCLGSASDLLEGKFYMGFEFLLPRALSSTVGGVSSGWYFGDSRGDLSVLLHSLARTALLVIPGVS